VKIRDFQSNEIVHFSSEKVQTWRAQWPDATILQWQRNDSLATSAASCFALLQRLNECARSSANAHIDEQRTRHNQQLEIALQITPNDSCIIRFFRDSTAYLATTAAKRQKNRPLWFFSSSQQPGQYYELLQGEGFFYQIEQAFRALPSNINNQ
jgi:hypothetical protein